MKNLAKTFILVFSLFLLTGCGEEKLTCTQVEEESEGTMTQTLTMSFKEDKLNKISTDMSFKMNDSSEINEYHEDIKDELEYIKGEGITTSSKVNGNEIIANYTIDFSKINTDEMDEEMLEMKDVSKEEAKETFEELGYSCK